MALVEKPHEWECVDGCLSLCGPVINQRPLQRPPVDSRLESPKLIRSHGSRSYLNVPRTHRSQPLITVRAFRVTS